LKKNELSIIQSIRRRAAKAAPQAARIRLGIGDDAAVLEALPRGQELLVTTDLLIEGSHFRRERHPARALGHKALARGLSDIAAMGGQPLYALLSVCLPPWAGEKWRKQFFAGLFHLARSAGVALVGGDLSAGGRFAADIVVLGSAARGQVLQRSRAAPGELIYVSGSLGGSALGLARLRRGQCSRADPAVRRHLYPIPRLALGRFLAEKLHVQAAMDLSDGLSLDLFRMAAESRVGAEIWAEALPVFPGANRGQALHGGEDYELLFTLGSGRQVPRSFEGVPLTAIGVVTRSRRLSLIGPGGRRTRLPVGGFQHKLA